jgi:flagellar motility protein MotE (MotC chaperone)
MTLRFEQPRVLPVVVVALAALFALKAANLWVGFATADASLAPSAPPSQDAAEPVTPRRGDVEQQILMQLSERRAALDRREQALETRERVLSATEARVEARLAELEAKETAQAALIAADEDAAARRYEALSNAYERMKPREAARIFELLEDDLLLPVAERMRAQPLSGVLAEMAPEKAERLTRLLAQSAGDRAQ